MERHDPLPLYYAGIGSQETPNRHLTTMRRYGRDFARRGWILRSGAADGADSAFEAGAIEAGGATDIFLPWRGFNCHLTGVIADRLPMFREAMEIASDVHPRWDRASPGGKKLLARDVMQVLGRDLKTPVAFVLCWAPRPLYDYDGHVVDVSGGTGLAVRLAAKLGIPVCHMDYHLSMARLPAIIDEAELKRAP